MSEFEAAVEDLENEGSEEEPTIDCELNGRKMKAFHPTEGQLVYMMAAFSRGRESTERFTSVVNLLTQVLREEDRDFLEAGLLTRDKAKRIEVKDLEELFERLSGEWFARPTQSPSGSAE